MKLADWKDVASIAQSVANVVAIIVGGILAWHRWGREAPQAARGGLAHRLSWFDVSPTHRLVHVALEIRNTGTRTLRPAEAYSLIQQLAPLGAAFERRLADEDAPIAVTGTEYEWPVIARKTYDDITDVRIDSTETETVHSEFLIPRWITGIVVYSLVSMDPDDPDVGWDITTLQDLQSQTAHE
jgi:hypothetical protein